MDQLATGLLLLLAAIMALQLFKGGPARLKMWLESKFLGSTK